jgi:DNA-binding MarR family transcriptional regulator
MAPPSGSSPRLDEQLCFALYAASRAVTSRYRPLLEELGLTYPQYLVMLVLWERGPLTIKELDEALHLDYGTLSPLLKRLEATGLVDRRRRRDDERSVRIELTDAGRALERKAEKIPSEMAGAMGMEERELTALRKTIEQLAASVSADAGTAYVRP